MDREEAHKAMRREKDTLQQSLMDDVGTPEQTAQWLARLEELDPEHFDDFDREYQDHLEVTQRVRVIKARLSDPISKAELANMINSIKKYQEQPAAASDDQFWDYEAQYYLLQQVNPDADWAALVSETNPEMTAEEIVEAGLAQKRRVFVMPGPVDEHWNQAKHTAGG